MAGFDIFGDVLKVYICSISQFLVFLQENLVESKHHKLARSLRSGPSDHDLKPNAATRDQLNVSNCKSASFQLNNSSYSTSRRFGHLQVKVPPQPLKKKKKEDPRCHSFNTR